LSSDMRHHDLESKPASAIIAAQVFHTASFAGTTSSERLQTERRVVSKA
jgi:hypothetical protein